MRKSFVTSTIRLMERHENVVLLLCDIGVHGFKEAFQRFPDRTFNIGIMEQSTVSLAAGWALRGYVPIVHTIAPFLVERAFEQLKIDFGYQKLRGIFVSAGGSYDYASLGCTHHCPADVALVENIPGFSVVMPGTTAEVESALWWSYTFHKTSYVRLSERKNTTPYPLSGFERVQIAESKTAVNLFAVGPVLDMVVQSSKGLDVNIFYMNMAASTVVNNTNALDVFPMAGPSIVVEPHYPSSLSRLISERHWPKPVAVRSFSIPVRFIDSYGPGREIDEKLGFTAIKLRDIIERL